MFIWPYKNVVMYCFKHAIIDVIVNIEKNCHITVHICILFLGMTILYQNLIINTNIKKYLYFEHKCIFSKSCLSFQWK